MNASPPIARWFWLLVLPACVGFAWLNSVSWQGCREMPAIIIESEPLVIEYDAENEAILRERGDSMGSFERSWRQSKTGHEQTLAEPIAIINWQGDASTWEVFFATNRGVTPGTAGGNQVRFGNAALATPLYGRAEITLPWRRRGVDPSRQPPTADRPPPSPGTLPITGPQCLSFDSDREFTAENMAEGVRTQLSRSRQQDLLIFVHGFNVDFESALIRTAQLSLDIPFNGAVVAYCWPSQGGVGRYGDDEKYNADSVQPFTEFLTRLLAAVPVGTSVNIIVHSMGNRIVLQALGKLPAPQATKPIANLVLCAPDVGRNDLKKWAPGAIAQAERITLYANRGDTALVASGRLHEMPRAGDAHRPLCLEGIETIDVSSVDFDLLLGHSYYGSNLHVLSDLFFVLKEHRPASRRPHLTCNLRAGGPGIWEFTSHPPCIRCSWQFAETRRR